MNRFQPRAWPSHLILGLALAGLIAAAPSAVTAPLEAQAGRAAAETPQARAEHVATVEGISEYRLPNGLRIVLFSDASRPSTTVNITYFVGSRHESYGETGMAHLLEHLLFKGTPTHPDIPQELTERGGRANGTTWYDRTNYFITFPESDDNLEWAIRLEADRMVNSFVRQEDLDSEMTVVRNEWEASENSPFGVTMRRTMAQAYQWHGYGRATIGARSDIENVPIERLQAFYRRYYQPDNAILAISGSFDQDRTLRWVEQYFGSLPRPERAGDMLLWETYTREPVQDGERMVTVRRVGDVQFVMAAYHIPPGAHEEFPAVDLLTHVLGNTPSGRLYQALVETQKATRVGTTRYQLREPGILLAFAEARADQSLDEVRAELVRVLDDVAANPPTEEEVERARAARIRDMQRTLSNSEWVGITLTEWAATGDWRLMFIHRDRLREVTSDEVARAARTYLVPANRTVGLFIPETNPVRAQIPDVPDIEALVADYRGTEVIAEGEVFETTHANIEARTRRLELDNGFRVALMPKQTRGNTVHVRWTQRIGNESDLMCRSTAGSLAAGMLMRGTQHRTRQQLTDELARLETQMFVGGSATMVTGNIETARENLGAVLGLLREVIQEPAFDAQEFATLKRERIAALESQRSEPQGIGPRTFQRIMNPREPCHPQYTPTFEEAIAELEATTLEDVIAFYREFHGAGDGGNLTLLGAFDPAEAERFARGTFGDWARQRVYARIPSPYQAIPASTTRIETPDKANAFFMAGTEFPMRDDHPDYPAMLLAGYMMGGGFLNSRLATRIRQKEGISYGIGASISASPLDERGTFTTFAIYAPENADRLVAAFREEVERAIADGFTLEEVEAAKRGWMQQRDVGRATDGQLVGTIHGGLFLDRTLHDDEELEARVRALTPEQIHTAFRRHIDPSAITIVKAGDFGSVAGVTEDG
jgi:zinc protease